MAGGGHVGLGETERLFGGDAQLVGDEVPAGDQLRHRVLDLEARVHLEERGRAALVHEELAGAGAHVADRAREGQGPVAESRPERTVDRRRRGLLEDLLVPTLDRAVPLAEVDAVPHGIEEDLDLDVATALDEPLEDQAVVAERRRRLPAGAGEGIGQCRGIADDPHALAAAASRRLDEDRVADPLRGLAEDGVRLARIVVPRQHRNAQRRGQLARRGLVAHRPDRRRWRTDPAHPGRADAIGEVGVLGEEPEAGVDGIAARRDGGSHDRARVEQVQRGGPVGRRDDGDDAERRARPRDPRGDLTAVRDEQPRDERCRGRNGRIRVSNAPNASDATRHRPPTRRAGNRPASIQRWTVRVDVPRRFATSLGLSSSAMSVAIVAYISRAGRRAPRR